jgi:hypothetical protein
MRLNSFLKIGLLMSLILCEYIQAQTTIREIPPLVNIATWKWWSTNPADWGPCGHSPYMMEYRFGVDIEEPGVKHSHSCHPDNGWELFSRRIWDEDEYDPEQPAFAKQTVGVGSGLFEYKAGKYFAIYNKYTGVLRTFIFITNRAEVATSGRVFVELDVIDSEGFAYNNHSLFSFELGAKGYTIEDSKYGHNGVITYSYANADKYKGDWVIIDTKLSYDPNIDPNARLFLRYRVKCEKIDKIRLGGEFNFSMANCDNNPEDCRDKVPLNVKSFQGSVSGTSTNQTNFGQVINKASKYIKTTEQAAASTKKSLEGAATIFKNIAKEDNLLIKHPLMSIKSWQTGNSLMNLAGGIGKAVPYVAAASAVLEGISEIFNLGVTQQPLISYSFAEGTIHLDGQILSVEPIDKVLFSIPGSKVTFSEFSPYWIKTHPGVKLGLININDIKLSIYRSPGEFYRIDREKTNFLRSYTKRGFFSGSLFHSYRDFDYQENFISMNDVKWTINPYHAQYLNEIDFRVLPFVEKEYSVNGKSVVLTFLADDKMGSSNSFGFKPFSQSSHYDFSGIYNSKDLIPAAYEASLLSTQYGVKMYWGIKCEALGQPVEILKPYITSQTTIHEYDPVEPKDYKICPNDEYHRDSDLNYSHIEDFKLSFPFIDLTNENSSYSFLKGFTPSTAIVAKDIKFQPCIVAGSPDFFWDFGDQCYSYDSHPIHKFGQKGKYRVKLTAVYQQAFGYPISHTESIERDINVHYDITPIINLLLD